MLFPTIDFAIFFLIVFTVSWLTMPHARLWRWCMLAASYVFYGWWNWRFVPLIAGSSLANQFFAHRIAASSSPRTRKAWLFGAVAANLAVLGTFKYYGFFVSSVINGLRELGVNASAPVLQFVLPVGISFFTFQALSYVIDIYRGEAEPSPLLDFSVYLAFFPQLVAGPIVRARELLPQFATPRDPRMLEAPRGFYLIMTGLFKKIVLADLLARAIVDPVFAAPSQHTGLEVLAAIYGFSIQIYCDFSGYTDIAIGVALLLGFRLPDNFTAPYAAVSIQDFWRRWHITLSRWLRDYLYIPLGGSHGGRWFTYRNLLLTMLLGGLWHGAAWTFVIWGGLHGLWLGAGRWKQERTKPEHEGWTTASAWDPRGNLATLPVTPLRQETSWVRLRKQIITFHLVTFAWVLFRAQSLDHAWEVLARLGTWGPAPAVTPAVLLAILAGLGVQYLPDDWTMQIQAAFSRLRPVAQGVLLAAVLVVIDALGPQGLSAFIYYQF